MVTQTQRDLEGLGVCFVFFKVQPSVGLLWCVPGGLVPGSWACAGSSSTGVCGSTAGPCLQGLTGCWVGRDSLDFPVLSQVRHLC